MGIMKQGLKDLDKNQALLCIMLIMLALVLGLFAGLGFSEFQHQKQLEYVSDTYFNIVTEALDLDVDKIMKSYEYCEIITNNTEMKNAIEVLRSNKTEKEELE